VHRFISVLDAVVGHTASGVVISRIRWRLINASLDTGIWTWWVRDKNIAQVTYLNMKYNWKECTEFSLLLLYELNVNVRM